MRQTQGAQNQRGSPKDSREKEEWMGFRSVLWRGLSTFGYLGFLAFVVFISAGHARRADAAIFQLANGGEIFGELVNANRTDADSFVIRSYSGGEITLAATNVLKVVPQRPVEIAYTKKLVQVIDSVEGHLQLAEWCGKNRLKQSQKKHLQHVLQIDPDHPTARSLLGYSIVDGKWMTRDEKMRSRGYVRDGSRWVLPQEKELREKQKQLKQAEREWYEKIKRYSKWLTGNKRVSGREHLLDIKDPRATPALIYFFAKAKRQENVEILARALTNVGTAAAFEAIVSRTIVEANDDISYFCLELLEQYKPAGAIAVYVDALRSKDNVKVNRAGRGLSFVGDSTVVRHLIRALVTQHKFKIGKENPGAVSTSFGGAAGSKGTGFVSGGGPKIVAQNMRNKEVLGALRSITGKDFDYDMGAWNTWYESQKPPEPKINSRRDED
ncbi:MAG: hypothetical protein CBB70_05595 [Planctomycetaceae bacterium TMED10]|nr:MAG: hypothetical protein CBB70_05595 [Planctomycetaceae bacterium TMED10]